MNDMTPCDFCKHSKMCGQQNKACEQFAMFVMNGFINEHIPREPTFTMHYRLFDLNDHNKLFKEINKKMRKSIV